jgi:hypothetical protein
MPTRKQRRRRQKELRHDYEYVYVDDEGQEVEVEPEDAEPKGSRRNGTREATAKPPAKKSGKTSRPARQVQPPSWTRVAKRALIFGPLIFIAFSVLNKSQSVLGRLAVAAVYTAFFIPFMYLMDRQLYRSYLRRTGQQPAAPARGKRRSR